MKVKIVKQELEAAKKGEDKRYRTYLRLSGQSNLERKVLIACKKAWPLSCYMDFVGFEEGLYVQVAENVPDKDIDLSWFEPPYFTKPEQIAASRKQREDDAEAKRIKAEKELPFACRCGLRFKLKRKLKKHKRTCKVVAQFIADKKAKKLKRHIKRDLEARRESKVSKKKNSKQGKQQVGDSSVRRKKKRKTHSA